MASPRGFDRHRDFRAPGPKRDASSNPEPQKRIASKSVGRLHYTLANPKVTR